jgi:hypothetical protein
MAGIEFVIAPLPLKFRVPGPSREERDRINRMEEKIN